MEIHITNPDNGAFILAMLKPGTDQWIKSGMMTAGGDADSLKEGIKVFHTGLYGVEPIVTMKFVDQHDEEVEQDAPTMLKAVYTIETPTALDGPTVDTIMTIPLSSFSQFDFVYPPEIQLSSPPLSGKFWVECHNTDGNTYATSDIDIRTVTADILKSVLETDCSFLKDKISVQMLTDRHSDRKMGVEFQVFFHGVVGSLEQYKLVAVPDYMDDPLIGVDIYTEESVVRPFGESLLFQIIPGEYLFTRETMPQVIVTVDDLPALCAGLACHYEYVYDTALISGFSVDA